MVEAFKTYSKLDPSTTDIVEYISRICFESKTEINNYIAHTEQRKELPRFYGSGYYVCPVHDHRARSIPR
jgi:hypothetical protein